jgi:pimeloyl-ACP methyl ester carboxylesterase
MKMITRLLLVFYLVFVWAACKAVTVHCQGEHGPKVFLIGGGPAFTTWNLSPIQNHLAKTNRVCRWDMRGVGDNANLPVETGRTLISQWLDDMQTVLPNEPVILWGHSWGALQVLLFANAYPERVSKVILSNPVDPGLLSIENIEQKLFVHPEIDSKLTLEDIGTKREKRHYFRSKIASYFLNAEQGWKYSAGFDEQDTNNELNVQVWEEYRSAPLAVQKLDEITAKMGGIVYCEADVLQPESLKEYRRLFPSAPHHVIAGCSHFPWEENPIAYYKVLISLIE